MQTYGRRERGADVREERQWCRHTGGERGVGEEREGCSRRRVGEGGVQT